MSSHPDIFGRLADCYAGRGEPENLRPLAVLYWRLILLAAVAGTAVAACISVMVFLRVLDTISVPTSPATAASPMLNRAELGSMLKSYEERAARYEQLKNTSTVDSGARR